MLLIPLGIAFSILMLPLMLLNPKSWRFNGIEARELLQNHLSKFRELSAEEIRSALADETQHCVAVFGASGQEYQIEVEGSWEEDSVRLFGSIDDGRLRAFCPLTEEIFISLRDFD